MTLASRYLWTALVLGCGSPPPAPASPPAVSHAAYRSETVALPGANPDGIGMDYLLYNPRTKAVWVPAGNTGAVDVIDTATRAVRQVSGFATKEMERRGTKRIVGPSSATLGVGVVYVGNRGDNSVCAIDEQTLEKRSCGVLDTMPDGIAYVDVTKEVWVTTPRDKSIRILDAATLAQKDRVEFDGEPEGFAVDETRMRFYTNLEDKDVTLAIDLLTRRVLSTWKAACGENGPHGLRFANAEGILFVACSTKVESLDVAHDGTVVGTVTTGDGVDDLDYSPEQHTLYVGAANDANLTVVKVGPSGALVATATVPTQHGARNGVVDPTGRVYLAHGQGSEVIVITPQ